MKYQIRSSLQGYFDPFLSVLMKACNIKCIQIGDVNVVLVYVDKLEILYSRDSQEE